MGMQMTVEDSKGGGLVPHETILPAKVKEVKKEKQNFADEDGQVIYKMVFQFEINDPSSRFDGDYKWGRTSVKFTAHPDCKLFSWSQAILLPQAVCVYPLDLCGR